MRNISFADNLKRLREVKGLTKEELGSRVGVSGVAIGYWETGRNEPRMSKIILLADVLEVDLVELIFTESPYTPLSHYVTDKQKRAIKVLLSQSEEDLELFIQLMERVSNKM